MYFRGDTVSSRIGLISDVHATAAPVAEALACFRARNVDEVFCLGDIAGYGNELDETVALLIEHGCRAIRGNHEIWYLEDQVGARGTQAGRWFETLPRTLVLTIEQKRLYFVHASPPDSVMDGIKLLDVDGRVNDFERDYWAERLYGFEHDILLVGHTHQVFCQQFGDALVINPGSSRFNHSCAILTLPDLDVEFINLSGKELVKSWNWSKRGLLEV